MFSLTINRCLVDCLVLKQLSVSDSWAVCSLACVFVWTRSGLNLRRPAPHSSHIIHQNRRTELRWKYPDVFSCISSWMCSWLQTEGTELGWRSRRDSRQPIEKKLKIKMLYIWLIDQTVESAKTLKTFAPPNSPRVCSTEGKMYFSRHTALFSFVRPTQTQTVNLFLDTSTMPEHQSVGSSTFSI